MFYFIVQIKRTDIEYPSQRGLFVLVITPKQSVPTLRARPTNKHLALVSVKERTEVLDITLSICPTVERLDLLGRLEQDVVELATHRARLGGRAPRTIPNAIDLVFDD